jgi:glycosyltransferase involved in cell wall biosynthesis
VQSLDIVISPSEFFKGLLEESIQGRIVHIPNFAPHPPKSTSSTDFSDFFLYAGVLERAKGILSLVNLLKEQRVDVKLLIAGNGSLRHKIKEFIKRHNLESKIVLLGWVDHDLLYRLLHDANALIVPSTCLENCPLISLEALSVGTPVIASNNGGLPEIVGKVDRKLIFDNRSKLKDILQGFSRKEFSSQMVRQIYEQNFSPEAHIDKYVGIIRECLGT